MSICFLSLTSDPYPLPFGSQPNVPLWDFPFNVDGELGRRAAPDLGSPLPGITGETN